MSYFRLDKFYSQAISFSIQKMNFSIAQYAFFNPHYYYKRFLESYYDSDDVDNDYITRKGVEVQISYWKFVCVIFSTYDFDFNQS